MRDFRRKTWPRWWPRSERLPCPFVEVHHVSRVGERSKTFEASLCVAAISILSMFPPRALAAIRSANLRMLPPRHKLHLTKFDAPYPILVSEQSQLFDDVKNLPLAIPRDFERGLDPGVDAGQRLPSNHAIPRKTSRIEADADEVFGRLGLGFRLWLGVSSMAAVGLLARSGSPSAVRCILCTSPEKLNRFDAYSRDRLRWRHPEAAAVSSDIVLGVLMPAAVLGLTYWGTRKMTHSRARWLADLSIVGAAVFPTFVVTYSAKRYLLRDRPFVFTGRDVYRTNPEEFQKSFFSGHASLTFACAGATSALLLRRNAVGAKWWALGLHALAGTAAYLRVGADRHYVSDVLAGAAVGAAFGWASTLFALRSQAPTAK